jgi:glutaconate CoA-transferase subunit B
MVDYTLLELMAVCSAREIKNKDVVFVGTGLPMLGAMLAKATHAPESVLIFESGVVGARPARTPVSIGDPCLVPNSTMLCGLLEVFGVFLQKGYVDTGFIGAAQIDKFGNLNSTVIGDYFSPKVRLPGSGGANDIGSLAHKTVIMMKQDKRKFVEKVDYCTTPGYIDGPLGRKNAGLIRGGPYRVITNLGTYGFDKETKEMYLETYHPGVTIEDIKNNVSWPIKISEDVHATPEPTAKELDLLRNKFDPQGIFLRK